MVGTRRSTPAGRTRGKDSSRRRTVTSPTETKSSRAKKPAASSASKAKTPSRKSPSSAAKKASSKPSPKKRSRASDAADRSPTKRTKTTKKTPSQKAKEEKAKAKRAAEEEEDEELIDEDLEEEEGGEGSKKPARLSVLEEACILAEEGHKSGGKSKKERIADAKERAKKWAEKDKGKAAASGTSAEPKKRRGRKKGSKNKQHRADSVAASVARLISPNQAPGPDQVPIQPMMAAAYAWPPPQMYGVAPPFAAGMVPPQVQAAAAAGASAAPESDGKSPGKGKKVSKKTSAEWSEAIEHAKREAERATAGGAASAGATAAAKMGPPPPGSVPLGPGYGWAPVYGPRPPGAFFPPGAYPPTHTMPMAQAKAAAAAGLGAPPPNVAGVKNYTKSGKLKSMTPGAIKARERRAKKKLEHIQDIKKDSKGVAEKIAAAAPTAAVAIAPARAAVPPMAAVPPPTDSSEATEKVAQLNIDSLSRGKKHHLRVNLKQDGVGSDISIPVIVARGKKAGPVLGITAALHGNELNGINVIHKLIDAIDVKKLSGTVIAVTVVNVPGYLANTREFSDGADLNRIMPGKEPGSASQVYAHRFMERVVKRGVEYLIDLHTASFGRVNSYYVRANMKKPVIATMARLMEAEIILHNDGTEKTLRSAAESLGIHSMTVEVGDPQRFQKKKINSCLDGIRKVMSHLKMLKAPPQPKGAEEGEDDETISCNKSYWLFTEEGGLLEVFPELGDEVRKGELIARVNDVFGNRVRDYKAPEAGVVVGKSTNPVAFTGARILHLGILGS